MKYTPDLIEAARARLRELAQNHASTFWMACEAAHTGRSKPRDADGLLRDPRSIIFTGENGQWLPGYRELVVELTAVSPADDMEYVVQDAPPMPVAVTAEAA